MRHVASPRRVTVVAHELRGIRPAGGMGTATTFLALALARIGHSVELLLGRDSPPLEPYWRDLYDQAGIHLRRAPQVECEPWCFVHAHCIELGLREATPDVVIAHDFGGPAYTALRLRQAGIAFGDTLFVVYCHGTRRYMMDVSPNLAPKDLRNLLGVTVHEQAAVELADVVVSPSRYLIDWMRAQGWNLPSQTLVIPYLTRPTATGESASRRRWSDGERLERLSFFGRVDEKKGVALLIAAVNALPPALLDGLELEFVGKTTSTWPPERVLGLLSPATRQALRDVTFETELDQHEALERLSRSGSLVVMPSLQDNSPNAVYECLEHEIPFVATHVGGVPELIAPEDHARVLVQPDAASLEAVLRKVLSTAVVPAPARAAVSGGEALERWSGVIGLEAARPTGVSARADAADFVLVSGPDVVPDPELLDVLIQTQARTGADVVSCGVRVRTDGAETPSFFSGDAGGLGALDNVYGTVALIREALLDAPPASPSEPEADVMWPLLARLAAKGARIVSVPVPLATTDRRPGSVETDPGAALLVAQELEHALPDPLRTTGRLVAGLASPR